MLPTWLAVTVMLAIVAFPVVIIYDSKGNKKPRLLSMAEKRQRRQTQEFWCITAAAMVFPVLLLLVLIFCPIH